MNENQQIAVFLADDHDVVREGFADLLERHDDIIVVGHCNRGSDVLEKVRQLRPDVAVLDLAMPGLNGVDACKALSEHVPNTSVLILTMYDDDQFVARALRNGAVGYLLKDAPAVKFVEAVRSVARGEVYLGPGISQGVLREIGKEVQDHYERLTMREREVLQLIAEDKTNRVIAEELGLSVRTVDTHRSRLMKKLDIHSQTGLVLYAIRKGLIHPR